MSNSIAAVYEHGVLRPLEPLTLPERRTVRIQILPEPVTDKAEQIMQFLHKVGLLTPPPHPQQPALISKEERRKLSDALRQSAKESLSEIVIEDRGQW
ncbi:antitoxin family protein [Candidatus Electronema sp. PJ]|uniref:antitoxin family protein n=1 Tax=Candidatus Electronema sp. PJ TaxID=3401572 RepID=UPI003AA99ACF